MEQSLSAQVRSLEAAITAILSRVDIDALEPQARRLIANFKRLLVDARLDARDYEYAGTRAEQITAAKAGRDRFAQLEQALIASGEYAIFGAADVAQFSAQMQHIMGRLE